MAHVMKMTRGAVGHISKHYERAKNEKGEYVKFGNEDIDAKRTHLNYNLAPKRNSQGEFIKQRCSEVKCLNRKDVNVACSWVVTLPKDFKELNRGTDPKDFFKSTYNFLENRYGKDNVISAYVHMDETTPHMHFYFVPVTYDKKKEHYKVSAKEVVNRYDLQTFHKDLSVHLNQDRIYANVLNQATVEGNKSIEELKRGTAKEKLNNALKEVEEVKGHIKVLAESENALKSKIETLEGKVLTLQEVNQVKIKKPLLGGEKAFIKMPYQDAINLKRTAERIGEVEQKEIGIENAKKELAKGWDEVRKIPLKEQKERIELQRENNRLNKEMNMVSRVMEKRPDIYEEIKKEVSIINSPKARNRGFSQEI